MKNNITISRDELTGRTRIQIDIDTNSLYEQDLKNGVDYMFFRASATVDDVKRLEYTLRGLYDILTAINKRKEDMNRAAQAQAQNNTKAQQAPSFSLSNQLQPGLANGGGSLVGALGSTANLGQSNIGALSGLQDTNIQKAWADNTLNSTVEALRQEMKEAVKELYKDEPPSKMKEVLSKFFRSHK